jgi:hypothetical protein
MLRDQQDKTTKIKWIYLSLLWFFVYWVTKGYVVLDDASFLLLLVKEKQNRMIILFLN